MELYLSSTKIDTYGDIYGLPFSFYGICIALAYGVMSRTYGSDRTGTVSFIITMQLHTLLGMKAGDMALPLHCICIMIFG